MSDNQFQQLHQELRNSQDLKKWLAYSTLVRDTLPVLEHALSFASQDELPQVYLLMAFHHERVTRDFKSANKCFIAGGIQLKEHLHAFEHRMIERQKREFKDPLDEV